MKKSILLLSLFVLFLSCSSDDKSDNLKNHPIVGSWILAEFEFDIDIEDYDVENQVFNDLSEKRRLALDSNLSVDFFENGEFETQSNREELGGGKYTVKDNKLTLSDKETSEKFYYSIYFNRMTIEEDQTELYQKKAVGTNQNLSKLIHRVILKQIFIRVY